VTVAAVTVAPATTILPVNGTTQLTKTFNPANATNQNVTWTSNNTNVATVTASGLVTAKALGTAIVTCTSADGNKTSASSITVSANVQFVDVDNAAQGTGTNQFNFTGTWSHAISSSDPYMNNTLSFSNTTNNTVTVSFTGNKVELYSAKASHHGIVAVSIDNGPETNVDLYSSTRQNFAMVHGSAALTQGTHTIKMRVTGNRNSLATGAYVIVDYLKIYSGGSTAVSSISVSPATVSISVDGTTQLSKTVLPSTATNQNVTWKSSNTSVAVVNANGLVTGVSVGTATISALTADGGKSATSSVTVSIPSNAVEFDNASRGTSQNQFNFAGSGWSHAANTADPYFNNTVSFSNVSGNIVTVPFTGNKIEFFSSKATHHGIVAVSIDNGAEVNVDLHAASRQNYVMAFASGNLAQGPHTLKIRVTGSKNSASTGTYAVVDYVKVYSAAVGGGSGGMAPEIAAFEEETGSPMEYYPNPILSGDMLHVILPEAAGQVTLMDIAGIPQRTFIVTGSELEIPTSGLFKGMYLLEYKTMKGREVVKIMVQ
jgi:uncharacterized protein YjdB